MFSPLDTVYIFRASGKAHYVLGFKSCRKYIGTHHFIALYLCLANLGVFHFINVRGSGKFSRPRQLFPPSEININKLQASKPAQITATEKCNYSRNPCQHVIVSCVSRRAIPSLKRITGFCCHLLRTSVRHKPNFRLKFCLESKNPYLISSQPTKLSKCFVYRLRTLLLIRRRSSSISIAKLLQKRFRDA